MNLKHNHIVRAILLVISLGLSLSAGRTILELWQRRDVVRVRERELTRLQEENKTLERTLQDIEGDTYLERIARDKLGMVREGETIVIMPEAGRSGVGTTSAEQSGPNWKKWWKLFF